ncbi:DUF2971 domain-containing protein [Rathayibacter sp. VKM Ac-2857]|uniref:DUF2971 domain-containing protein n=1 Tax=Rathayibacter sp. VKM Ac-2857 TaxID=2739020 RepID=UPI0015666D6B|nr:DUF2971 domain-containing protein [Rathayibacter sp. VKM Ac-2857]NQX15087.1 DUF2971 domain-containing protein [Rathayibacter sp. VKM Ac-2857]
MRFENRPDIDDLEDDVVLWRYVDLFRYLDLLQTGELYFARADKMEDPWEGSNGAINISLRAELFAEHNVPLGSSAERWARFVREHFYLNCWYRGLGESYAMWRLYGAAGKGVAIRTTAGRLKSALRGEPSAVLAAAVVQYADYSALHIPGDIIFIPLVYKRESFSYEREYRLIAAWFPGAEQELDPVTGQIVNIDNPPASLREPVDVLELIEAVFVSPDAPEWEAKVIRDVTSIYYPDIEVRQSDLNANPMY